MKSFGLPRLRGDGPRSVLSETPTAKAPPPTRGWTRHRCDDVLRRPGSPAYAGMDLSRGSPSGGRTRLPRLRGDGPIELDIDSFLLQAPPPTRGWTPDLLLHFVRELGSPAYAGMDPCIRKWWTVTCWLPRLRGDGPEYEGAWA